MVRPTEMTLFAILFGALDILLGDTVDALYLQLGEPPYDAEQHLEAVWIEIDVTEKPFCFGANYDAEFDDELFLSGDAEFDYLYKSVYRRALPYSVQWV